MAWTLSKAMAEKCESLRSSQVPAAEYSAGGCSAGGACAPWNGTSTPQACCSQDRTTDASNPSPCGTTCRPSTGDPGVDAWTWFLAASPARTSAPPERAWESKAHEAECGSTWRELWARYDRDTCGWRTHRCLWDEGLDWSSLTLPRWGMMLDGVLWERATPALRIDESGSGCWPNFATPQARDFRTGGADRWGDPARSRNLNDQVAAMWPTPRAGNPGSRPNRKGGKILSEEVKKSMGMIPTPRAEDSQSCGAHRGTPDTLTAFTKMFPTPRTTGLDGGSNSRNAAKARGMWPTPRSNDAEKRGNFDFENPRNGLPASVKAMGTVNGGQLNPDWVELLMGWPLGWTRTDGSRPDVDGWRGAHAGGVPWGEGTAWERGVPRVAAKIPNRVGRLKCIGNGQVPAAMRLAWESLRNNRRNIPEML